MGLNLTLKTIILGAAVGLVFTGCGMLKGPISPLIDPPVASFGSFDGGTIGNWFFDGSNPVNVSSPFPLAITSEPVIQGAGALEIRIPPKQGSRDLVSYSVGVTYSLPGPTTIINMTNKTISIWVYWKSGLVEAPSEVGGQLFVKDINNKWSNGSFVKLARQRWAQVTFNTSSPNYTDGTDMTKVYEMGLQIAGSGSAYFTTEGVVVADSFGY